MPSTREITDEELRKIVDLSRYAPSVHNTQPWKVRKDLGGIEISIDSAHRLGAGDPTGRETIISLGIFAEAICQAAGVLGLSGEARFDEDKAIIEFKTGKVIEDDIGRLVKDRATDRSIYKKTNVDAQLKSDLEACATEKVRVWVEENDDFIRTFAELTGKGISLALSNPDFRSELRKYLILPWSRKKRGIAVRSLYIPLSLAILQPFLLRFGSSSGKEARLEKKRWISSSAVILITTEGDMHHDWFEAGRTYMKVSLQIEKAGLSQATSAAVVEAATFHEDIEKMLGTSQRLQAAIRIGNGAPKRRYSPRLSAEEIITSN